MDERLQKARHGNGIFICDREDVQRDDYNETREKFSSTLCVVNKLQNGEVEEEYKEREWRRNVADVLRRAAAARRKLLVRPIVNVAVSSPEQQQEKKYEFLFVMAATLGDFFFLLVDLFFTIYLFLLLDCYPCIVMTTRLSMGQLLHYYYKRDEGHVEASQG